MTALKNRRQEEFARRVVAGEPASKAYIAAGFSESGARQGASRLLTSVNVAARIGELRPAVEAKLEASVIGTIKERAERIQGYNDRRQAIYDLMAARATDPDHQEVPGIKTGFLTITFKGVNREKIKEASVDVALLRELRELEKQAAIELGQWTEKSEVAQKFESIEEMIAAQPPEVREKWLAQLEAKGVKPEVVQ